MLYLVEFASFIECHNLPKSRKVFYNFQINIWLALILDLFTHLREVFLCRHYLYNIYENVVFITLKTNFTTVVRTNSCANAFWYIYVWNCIHTGCAITLGILCRIVIVSKQTHFYYMNVGLLSARHENRRHLWPILFFQALLDFFKHYIV